MAFVNELAHSYSLRRKRRGIKPKAIKIRILLDYDIIFDLIEICSEGTGVLNLRVKALQVY